VSRRVAWTALVVAIVAGCDKPSKEDEVAAGVADSIVLNQREVRLEQALTNPDSADAGKPIALWKLPDHLKEISGLALTADDRLLAHGDERGKVFEVDYRRGIVVKEFTLGSPAIHGDFESIAIAGDSVLLFTSDGKLYAFPEGDSGAVVSYTMRDTGLGVECEFEGMAFDSLTNSLLFACKKTHNKALKDSLVIFRLPRTLAKNGKEQPSHIAIPMAAVIGSNGWDSFHPSDITIDRFSGNYVLVASRERALLEVTPKGAVVFSRPLPPGHDQAEGVAITKDHILIISDEAKGGPALITLYRWP
jgi:SdiA-regulated